MDLNHFPKKAIAEETGTTVMSGTFSIHQTECAVKYIRTAHRLISRCRWTQVEWHDCIVDTCREKSGAVQMQGGPFALVPGEYNASHSSGLDETWRLAPLDPRGKSWR